MLLYPRLPDCAVDYLTRKRADNTFCAGVEFLDKPDTDGKFQRTTMIYRREGFNSRSAARRHAEARQKEIVVRPDILQTYDHV